MADREAKTAITEGSSPPSTLPQLLRNGDLPLSLTAVGSAFKTELRARWKVIWAASPRRGRLAKIDAKLPSHSYLRSTDQLTHAQASILMQLRTGHIPLNQFLHRIGKVDSPACPACKGSDESVHHYLFDCPSHAYARHGLARTLGKHSKSLKHVLGNERAFKTVLKFVRETGRLKDVYGDLSMKTM